MSRRIRTSEIEELLDRPISDETAYCIGELLRALVEDWEERHFSQMRRYCKDHSPPPRDPEHPWR